MTRLSIITPVFNAAAFLDRCLKSILESTVHDIELLCVDDGSSDNSLALLQAWAAKDNRVKVFSQQNAGASAARNAALIHASGDYIIFVDADDEVEADYFEQCLDAADKYHADCAVTGWSVIEDEPGSPDTIERHPQNFAFYPTATPKDLAGMQPGVSGHLYARSVLLRSGVLFPSSVRYGEDTAFHYAQYACCTSYIQLPLTGYIVHRIAGSSSGSCNESVMDMIDALAWLYEQYERHNWPTGTNECLIRYAAHAWRRICSMAPHEKVLAASRRLAAILKTVPDSGIIISTHLRRKDSSALTSICSGGRGLSFSYYWKRFCNRCSSLLKQQS